MPDPCVSLVQHKRGDQSHGVCGDAALSCLQNVLESSLLLGWISELWGVLYACLERERIMLSPLQLPTTEVLGLLVHLLCARLCAQWITHMIPFKDNHRLLK